MPYLLPRDSRGRIERNRDAVEKFKRNHPKPAGCPTCEVDHIVPLSKGGRDDPSSMQWLPREQHQDKTRRELYGRQSSMGVSSYQGKRGITWRFDCQHQGVRYGRGRFPSEEKARDAETILHAHLLDQRLAREFGMQPARACIPRSCGGNDVRSHKASGVPLWERWWSL